MAHGPVLAVALVAALPLRRCAGYGGAGDHDRHPDPGTA
jgi:hypothetical protein